jgi:hypothetical protein
MFAGDAWITVDVEVGTADVGAERTDDAQPARRAEVPSKAIAIRLDRVRYVVSCIPQGLVA